MIIKGAYRVRDHKSGKVQVMIAQGSEDEGNNGLVHFRT